MLIVNKIYQVLLFRCINQYNEVSHLVREIKFLGGMKYSMMSVKRAVEAVGIWTEDNWDVKRVNSLYNMVSGRFDFKRNKRFYSLSWSSVVMYLYTRRVILLDNKRINRSRLGNHKKIRSRLIFSLQGFLILLGY